MLRVGALGPWSFCCGDRERGGLQAGGPPRFSRDTETVQVFKGGDGVTGIEYLRAGRTMERFEPGMATAAGGGPHSLFDRAQWFAAAQPLRTPALRTGLRAVGHYIGADVDAAGLGDPLLIALHR
ncbi:hypothetical protein [Streptomyces sp. XD-27]|uniref:hypothetical protein n=1 Tax=Streptomyces sp. XD-27 TaxID=3062779 RepID=UPI0026F46837|nr:hypothetical protein [Streptomyces sp. XD-27]WKX74023.1 hypothetical protein Q3Y56_32865 [Streptomyces sp. XD-27]